MRFVRRYWGFLILVGVVGAWLTQAIGPSAIALLSILAAGYFFFQAPVWCGAVTREGTLCRRNSSGLPLGCSYRQHKWQKLRMTVVPHTWRQLNRGPWTSPREGVTTLSALASVLSALAAVVAIALQQ